MLNKIGTGLGWVVMAGVALIAACVLVYVLYMFLVILTPTSLTELGATRLTAFEDHLYFFVTRRHENPRNIWVMWTNWELWASDGTSDGTRMIKPVYTGWNQPSISPAVKTNGQFFFAANGVEDKADAQSGKNRGGIWRSDGTAAGTVLVEKFVQDMLDVDGTLFFTKWGQESCDLYRSDGTESGTALLKHIPEPCAFKVIGETGRLFFATILTQADKSACKIWRRDGTASGTVIIKQFEVKPGEWCARDMVLFNDRLILLLTERGTINSELWISDSSGSEMALLRQIPGAFIENRNFRILHLASGYMFFSTTSGGQTDECALWVSDGTADGTHALKSVCLDQYRMMPVDNGLLFAMDVPPSGWELWHSDGTLEGTQRVRGGFTFGREGLRPRLLLVDNGILYLAINDDQGCALWRTDGTAAGTEPIQRACPEQMISVNDTLFYVLPRTETQVELWKSDGTEQGTVRVKTIP
jgi:ELWxxDGT repeat protein